MGSQYQHFGNLYVLRGIGSKDSHIGNVIASQWLDAFVHFFTTNFSVDTALPFTNSLQK